MHPISTIGREWIVIFVIRNTSRGKDCSTTNERYTTVRMFTRVVRNTKLKMQKRLQKKKHVNVCSAIDA